MIKMSQSAREKLDSYYKKKTNSKKNRKSANRYEQQNRKTEVSWHKNRKIDLKNGQNRKTENPNDPVRI